jgi:anti-anti-sigma regulatory factor
LGPQLVPSLGREGFVDKHAGALQQMVARICEARSASIRVELSGLTLTDSTCAHALIVSQAICREQGVAFGVSPGPPAIQRVLEIAGLADALPSRPSND